MQKASSAVCTCCFRICSLSEGRDVRVFFYLMYCTSPYGSGWLFVLKPLPSHGLDPLSCSDSALTSEIVNPFRYSGRIPWMGDRPTYARQYTYDIHLCFEWDSDITRPLRPASYWSWSQTRLRVSGSFVCKDRRSRKTLLIRVDSTSTCHALWCQEYRTTGSVTFYYCCRIIYYHVIILVAFFSLTVHYTTARPTPHASTVRLGNALGYKSHSSTCLVLSVTASGQVAFYPVVYRGQCGRGVKLTADLHLMPRLRMCGPIPPLPHTSSWSGSWLSEGISLPSPHLIIFVVMITVG